MNARTFVRFGAIAACILVTISLLFYEYVYNPSPLNLGGSVHVQGSYGTYAGSRAPDTAILDRTKVATIVETRARSNLVPLILHFANVLGPTWPIHVVGSKENEHLFNSSAVFQRHVAAGQITLTQLDPSKTFANSRDVSAFLASNGDFWQSLAPADHVLLFQADSILCSNSPRRIDDFLVYDFIGAPISSQYGSGFNGGLSLRNRMRMLEIIQSTRWDGEFEDQWFYKRLEAINATLPTKEVAGQFAVETIFAESPLGLHQVRRWHSGDHLARLIEWCPEVQLADGGSSFF
jgi:hypothetical protein